MQVGLKVLLVGFGFMGESHFNNLTVLEKEGSVRIAGVIDSDPSKLTNEKLQSRAMECFSRIQEAYQQDRYFDIVVVVTNTVSHDMILNELFACSVNQKKPPALFVEKPFVENTDQAKKTALTLEKMGYGISVPFTCGYLFRESPALDRAIAFLKEHDLKIEKVRTVWQKLRDTKRPSAGVHIDEATHPIDALINYLFPILGLSSENIHLEVSKRIYSRTIANRELQAKLYGEEHIPLATVDYTLEAGGIVIEGHSSFMEAPQKREIWLECSDDVQLKIAFDDNKTDHITVFRKGARLQFEEFKDPNKLLLELRTFLKNFDENFDEHGNIKNTIPSSKISNLQQAFKDIMITEALGTIDLHKKMTFQNDSIRLPRPFVK